MSLSSHTVDSNWLSPANLLLTLTPAFDDLFLSTLFSTHTLPFLKTHVLSHPTQRQIVFEVIGRRLVKEHFSGMVDTPLILEEPFMTNDVKMKMIEEFKDILTAYIVKSA